MTEASWGPGIWRTIGLWSLLKAFAARDQRRFLEILGDSAESRLFKAARSQKPCALPRPPLRKCETGPR